MFIKRNQLPQRLRRESFGKNGVRWPVAGEHAMGYKPGRCFFAANLIRRFTEGQSLRLCEHIREEKIVMAPEWIQRLGKRDEVARNELRPLVNQLIEGMLAVRPRFAPIDRSRLGFDFGPFESDMLAVTIHCELLQVIRKHV